MTSLAASAARTPAVDDRRFAPPEGWTSVLLLGVMLATLSLAVDGAGWAGRTGWGASETAFLVPTILLGGLVGLVLARSGLSWLAADAIGAAIGALFLVQAVAGVVSNAPDVGTRLAALGTSVALFYQDLVIEGTRSSQTSVFLLVIGALTWATGQYASILVFRRRRAVSAVVLTGLFLFIELSVTIRDQYLYLVVFTAAALLFLVRLNLVEQRAGWVRRRIGDTGHVSNLYVRSGLVFVALALAGALALTATATSAPLFGWWRGLDGALLAWGQRLNLVVGGVSGEVRGPSDLFASTATITGVWQASDDPVFDYSTLTPGGLYWLGATYDSFDGTTWHQTDRSAGVQVTAGGALLAPTTDQLEPRGELDKVTATVTDEDLDAPTVLGPELPTRVDRLATVYTSGRQGPFVSAEFVDSLHAGEAYTVDALAWSFDPETGLTGAKLA
ncbi:MAG TPA: transglutaminaseTgpA domain-containing protein, partial [Candidatus Limnocylindrales bacterium]|nr:transglutaminaseTgpA domain-containing protein [Candidatus Limnocylindrales bacterium]